VKERKAHHRKKEIPSQSHNHNTMYETNICPPLLFIPSPAMYKYLEERQIIFFVNFQQHLKFFFYISKKILPIHGTTSLPQHML